MDIIAAPELIVERTLVISAVIIVFGVVSIGGLWILQQRLSARSQERTELVATRFNIIFFAVIALTLVCGALAAIIAIAAPTSPLPFLHNAFEFAKYLFTAGVGAVFALLGARPIAHRHLRSTPGNNISDTTSG